VLIPTAAGAAAPSTGSVELAWPVLAAGALLGLLSLLAALLAALYRRERRRRRAAEDASARLASVAENDSRGVLVTDRASRVLWCNRGFTRLCGYQPAELFGRTPGPLLQGADTDPATAAALAAAVAAGAAFRGELLNYRKTGEPYWARLEIVPVRGLQDGGALQFVGFVEDVTEEKRRDRDLHQAIERAEAANRAKTHFLSAMSHELRTPLNAVIGFAELLQRQIHGPLGHASYASYAADIHKSGEMLRDLIGGILDLSKIEAGTIELRSDRIDLNALVGECLTVMRATARERDLEIVAAAVAPVILHADRQMLRQILLNLLTNACKFSHPGTRIEVSAGPTTDGFELTVRDHGVGIPAERLAEVTEPFVQLHSPLQASAQGAGIGLALVKQFAELHGGRLSLNSVVDDGTTARVLLPADRVLGAAEAASAPADPAADPAASAPRTAAAD
jgi:PAS domain S-box-containing protein